MSTYAEVCIQFIQPEAGGRDNAILLNENYRPHFQVNCGEYLGVKIDGGMFEPVKLGSVVQVKAHFVYAPNVDYSDLQVGVQFLVLEGSRIVGIGKVVSLSN